MATTLQALGGLKDKDAQPEIQAIANVATTLQVLGGLKAEEYLIGILLCLWQQPSRYWVG